MGPAVDTPSVFLSLSYVLQGWRNWVEQEAGCGWGDLHLHHLALKGCHFSVQVCVSVCVRPTAAHCWMETMKDAFTWQRLKIMSSKRKGEKPSRHNFTERTHFSSLVIKPCWSPDYVCVSKALQVRASLGQRVCMQVCVCVFACL